MFTVDVKQQYNNNTTSIYIFASLTLCYFSVPLLLTGMILCKHRWAGPGFDTGSGNILSFLLPLFARRAVVSYWRKYVHEVLVNRLGGLSLPRKSVVRLTDRPDMTLDVYRGRKTTMQQQMGRITSVASAMYGFDPCVCFIDFMSHGTWHIFTDRFNLFTTIIHECI